MPMMIIDMPRTSRTRSGGRPASRATSKGKSRRIAICTTCCRPLKISTPGGGVSSTPYRMASGLFTRLLDGRDRFRAGDRDREQIEEPAEVEELSDLARD